MGVFSLTRLIGSDCKSFKVKQLHSSAVIINGIEFLHVILKSLNYDCEGIFGVDHVCVTVALKEAICRLKTCGLDPIFVVQGLPPRHGKDYDWKVSRTLTDCRRRLKRLPASPASSQEDYHVVYSRSLLCLLLSELGMRFYVCHYGANSVCAALSIVLGCPVLSSNSDFYLFYKPPVCPQEDYKDVEYAPFSGLSLDPTLDSQNPSTMGTPQHFLTAHIYAPEFSPLKSIPESSRPLVALAMDSILVRELPSAVGVPLPTPGSSRVDSFTKLQCVVDWLQTVDPIQAIQAILECVGGSHHVHTTASNILDFLPKFLPDFAGASKLLSYLGVANDYKLSIPVVHSTAIEDFSPLAFFKSVQEILRGNTATFDRPEFTNGWPSTLQSLYHNGCLSIGLLTALYCKEGRIFNLSLPSLYPFPSEANRSRALRHLSYALFLGLEHRLGLEKKLIGLHPHVKEVFYNGNGQYKTCLLHVGPIDLPQHSSLDSFLAEYLSFDPLTDIPDWGNLLLLCCSVWHSQTEADGHHSQCAISQCPSVLSFLLCAVVHFFNSAIDTSLLLEHYSSILSYSLREGEKYGQTSGTEVTTVSVETSTVLDILELTNIYGELTELVCLINALLHPTETNIPTDSKYSSCIPLGKLVPSFSLAHQISLCLRLSNESAKSALAARFWLPKLFYPTPDPAAAMKLRDAAILFTKLVNVLPTVRVKWKPLVFDIIDPPAVFTSKGESPSCPINRKQSANPRKWVTPSSFGQNRHATHPSVCPPQSPMLHDSSNTPPVVRSSVVKQRTSAPTEYNQRKTTFTGPGRKFARGAPGGGGRTYADRLAQRYSHAQSTQ